MIIKSNATCLWDLLSNIGSTLKEELVDNKQTKEVSVEHYVLNFPETISKNPKEFIDALSNSS